jgi:hypothetical protein
MPSGISMGAGARLVVTMRDAARSCESCAGRIQRVGECVSEEADHVVIEVRAIEQHFQLARSVHRR